MESNNSGVESGIIYAGGRNFPLDNSSEVRVTYNAPPATWLLYALAAGIFSAMAALMFSVIFFSPLAGASNSSTTRWLLGTMLCLSAGLVFGVVIFRRVARRAVWKVELHTAIGKSVVYIGLTWADAQAYANRLRRSMAMQR